MIIVVHALPLLFSIGAAPNTCPAGTVDVALTHSRTATGPTVLAEDHLVPVARDAVLSVPAMERALAALPKTRSMQMLVTGAYGSEPEYAVYVEGVQAVAVRRRAVLEAEGAVIGTLTAPEIDELATAWAPLDADVVASLDTLWADALAGVRPESGGVKDRSDGATFTFTRWRDGADKSGEVWSPREDSPAMGALVDVGDALRDYASSSNARRVPLLEELRASIARAQPRLKAPGCVPVPKADADCKAGGKDRVPVVLAKSSERFGQLWPRLPPTEGTRPIDVVIVVDDGAPTEQCIRVRVRRGLDVRGQEHAFGFGTGLAIHDVMWTLVKARGRGENPVLVVP